MQNMKIAFLAVLSAAAASVLTGCGAGFSNGAQAPAALAGTALNGAVHGGQQPVVGATIQLYATGTTGYGSAATALIASTVKTTSTGTFSITGDYTCPASAQVYLVATGGNSGSPANNGNLALMAALGACSNLSAGTFISVNELTTVASVYPLAPFMAGTGQSYANIGTSPSNAVGLSNAMADVNVLVNIATGATPGSTVITGATLPIREMNTLADILAACVNSGGGSYNDGSSCGTLFANANPGGAASTAPTDTISALRNIAQHPATSTVNVAALYTLGTPTSPFQPTLASQPNDFTLALSFAGGSLSAPSALSADASGNIWIANAGANTVTELAHTGAALSGAGYTASLNAPSAVAVASDGTVWVTNKGNNTVSRLSAAGSAYAGAPYSGGGLNLPSSIAFDSLGTAWIANAGNASVTTFNSTGSAAVSYTPVSASDPVSIAVNPH